MALFSAATPLNRPNQQNGSGDVMALAIAEYSGIVEGTIERTSVMKPFVKMRPVRGTNTIQSYAVGKSTLGVVTPGEAPSPTGKHDQAKATLTVDTLVYARDMVPLLEDFQSAFDCREEYGNEHGKEIGKFFDQSLFIQAAKAAMSTQSAFSNGSNGKPAGHFGGSQVVLNDADDLTDPAMLLQAIGDLFVKMEQKDVIPRQDGIVIALKPREFYALQGAEAIVNGTYVTAQGTKLDNIAIFKAHGCPVVSSNNIPSTNIADHFLGSNYNGDFTKLGALAFSSRALLGGETIPLTSDVFYDKIWKHWFIDSHLSYGVTTHRREYAGAILLP